MCKVIRQNAKEHAKSSRVKHKEIRAKEQGKARKTDGDDKGKQKATRGKKREKARKGERKGKKRGGKRGEKKHQKKLKEGEKTIRTKQK